MAIDFPNSPTLNQEFTVGDRVWFWNGTAWKAKETAILETGKYIVSETAPANPEEGDGWFDSVNTREFIYYDGFWVETSAAAVGLPAANYATEEYVDNAVGAIDLTGYATETYVDNAISAIPPVDLTGYATETYVGNQIANLVDSAPSTLDTLNELAAALADDPSFATTITNSLANKSDIGHTHPISDVTNLQTSLDAKSNKLKNIISLSTSRAITATDSDSLLTSSLASDISLTIPLDQAEDLANGFKVDVSKISSGNISIIPGSGTAGWTSFTGPTSYLRGVATSPSSTVAIFGSSTNKTIYRTANDGTTWSQIGSTIASTEATNSRKISYSSGKYIIAANGSTYISDNDGVSFTQYSSGLNGADVFTAGAISTSGNTIILIKESNTSEIAISTDGGANFTYSSISLVTNHVPGDILYSETREAFYILSKGGASTVGTIYLYKSSDGITWTLVGGAGLSGSNTVRQIMAEKDGIIFFGGGTQIWASLDGSSLSSRLTLGSTQLYTQSYWLGDAFFVRRGSAVYTSTNFGITWSQTSSWPTSSSIISSLALFSSAENTIFSAVSGSSSTTMYKTGLVTVSLNGSSSSLSLETAEESIGLVKIGNDSWVTSTIPAESTSFASTITSELSNKASSVHTHTISEITDYIDPNFNWDGGEPTTNYGGIMAIDGGTV